jgi:ATP-dependent protease HslVU (ClpYQ) peptidase subunit
MTTIAFRDGVMAGDRAVKAGNVFIHDTTKVVRRPLDGALCGTCGMSALGAEFRRWFLAGEQGDRPNMGEGDEDIQAMIARADGKIEMHDRLGWSLCESEFVALGSGQELALGAMAMGASAMQAVEVAARFGVGQITSIDVERIQQVAVRAA